MNNLIKDPIFYGLPKIHKTVEAPYQELAKYLSKGIQSLTEKMTSYTKKTSFGL